MLTDDSSVPAARAASTDSVGSTHSDPRTYSFSASRPTMPTSAIRSPAARRPVPRTGFRTIRADAHHSLTWARSLLVGTGCDGEEPPAGSGSRASLGSRSVTPRRWPVALRAFRQLRADRFADPIAARDSADDPSSIVAVPPPAARNTGPLRVR